MTQLGGKLDRLLDSLSAWLMGEAIPGPDRSHSDGMLEDDLRELALLVGRPSLSKDAVLWRGVHVPHEINDAPGLIRTAGKGRRFQSWSTVRDAALAFARTPIHEEDGEPGFGYLYQARVDPNENRILLSIPDVCSFLRRTGRYQEALDTLVMFEPSEEVLLIGEQVIVESISAVSRPRPAPRAF